MSLSTLYNGFLLLGLLKEIMVFKPVFVSNVLNVLCVLLFLAYGIGIAIRNNCFQSSVFF